MKSANHSRGPWHACGNGGCHCKMIWTDNDHIATCVSGDWGDRINGKLMVTYGHIPEDVARANARLIAAVPDLLFACKISLLVLMGGPKKNKKICKGDKTFCVGVLRKAIAKAYDGERIPKKRRPKKRR